MKYVYVSNVDQYVILTTLFCLLPFVPPSIQALVIPTLLQDPTKGVNYRTVSNTHLRKRRKKTGFVWWICPCTDARFLFFLPNKRKTASQKNDNNSVNLSLTIAAPDCSLKMPVRCQVCPFSFVRGSSVSTYLHVEQILGYLSRQTFQNSPTRYL